MHTKQESEITLPLLSCLFLALLLSACQANPTSQNSIVTPEATLTISPTITPPAEPLGTLENPIILGVISQSAGTLSDIAGEVIAQELENGTNISVEHNTFSSYKILLNKMEKGEVHIAWLYPFSYLYASQNGVAEAVLLSNHFGIYYYATQFLAHSGSGFIPYFDPEIVRNTAEADLALQQFYGKRPCWVSPYSASGFVLPSAYAAKNGILLQEGVITQTHAAVVRALYITGICDFGATFAISGDPRTSSSVQHDLSDVMDRVNVIWQSEAIIPNLNISFHNSIPKEMQQQLLTAFIVLVQTQEGKLLLSNVNDYEIENLILIDNSVYDPFRELMNYSPVELETLIGF